jgi:hypothetical protein
MRFVKYVSHISSDFFREESGASPMENILLGVLIVVIFTLFMLALNKGS